MTRHPPAPRRAKEPRRAKKPPGPREHSPPQRHQQRDERRRELVHAAREVFGAKGYHEATVDDITRAAGVAKGTFYLYFGEKKEIYYELVRTFLGHLKDIGAAVSKEVQTTQDFFARTERAAHELLKVFIL